MGRAVFRPKDLSKGRRRIIENALSDINPDIKDGVIELLSAWQGMPSETKLQEMLGQERARLLLDRLANNRNQKQQL